MVLNQIFREAAKSALDTACPQFQTVAPEALQLLTSSGLSHDHVRIGDSGWLLRIPRGNQLGMSATDYLTLQQSCFTTAARSGYAPEIAGVVPPDAYLPDGALVVEEIQGRKTHWIKDAPLVGEALAHLHKIRPQDCGLQIAEKPFASQHFLITEIFGAAPERADISDQSKRLLENEQIRVRAALEGITESQHPLTLIGGDSHPANFLITPKGKAFLVDVEFAMFDSPAIDLADAALPITQRLDPDLYTWSAQGRLDFLRAWRRHADPDLIQDLKTSGKIAEDAVRLRTLLWLADWTGKSQEDIIQKISPRAQMNWDRMASAYLEPTTLATILNTGEYRYLPPLGRKSNGPVPNLS